MAKKKIPLWMSVANKLLVDVSTHIGHEVTIVDNGLVSHQKRYHLQKLVRKKGEIVERMTISGSYRFNDLHMLLKGIVIGIKLLR